MRHYLDKITPEIQTIISRTFPSYKGKKVSISTTPPTNVDSYWSGGSKNSFVFYDLTEGKTVPVLSNHPYFEPDKPRYLKQLPHNVLLVEHSIFCGKDMGITIYANPSNMATLIPENLSEELTKNEKAVLIATRSLKSSYGGVSDLRRHEVVTRERICSDSEYTQAKENMITKGYLDKRGAITPKGRNAVGNSSLFSLRNNS